MGFTGYGIGGGNLAAFYGVTVGATQTTLSSTTAVYVSDAQITTDGANDDAGIPTFTLEQIKVDGAFWTFIYAAIGVATGVTPEDLNLEDGTSQLGSAATGTLYASAFRGPVIAGGTDDGKRVYWGGLTKLAKSSGSVNFASGTYIKPNIVAVAQKIEKDLNFSTVLGTFASTAGTTSTIIAASTHPYGKWMVG